MIDLSTLEPIGRKLWAKNKWDAYQVTREALSIKESKLLYKTPDNEKFNDVLDKAKWKTTIDRKVNYLLARPPVCEGYQPQLDDMIQLLRDTSREYLLAGSLIWIVQGNGQSIDPVPMIMTNTIAVYEDENKQDVVAYIRKYIDKTIDKTTGAETEVEYFELYYETPNGTARDVFCFAEEGKDKSEVFPEGLKIIELGKTGDAPLYSYVREILMAFDHIMKHQDRVTEQNTEPLVEVRGYTGTDSEDLEYAVRKLKIAKTDGTGGVTVHSLPMDSNSIDVWAKRLLQEYYEATATVGKENELLYAQSGKAMDRLFVDMENSAREMASVLEKALVEYFEYIGAKKVDIVWNTDRPVDDVAIISGIQASNGIISQRTLLKNHPWVDDVDKELEELEKESIDGVEDLTDDQENEMNEEEILTM